MSAAPFRRHGLARLRQRGVVLLALLVALTLLGIGLMTAVNVWMLSRQREREQELLFVGEQYRQAIRRYYGAQRSYPTSLELLLEDDRYPVPVRHLRSAYPDPITGKADWGLLKVDDRILGVYSLSEAAPLKQAGFTRANEAFKDATSYKDWVFAYVPRRAVIVPATPASGAPPATPPLTPTQPRRSPQ